MIYNRTPLTITEIVGAVASRKMLALAVILTVIAVGEFAFRLMPPTYRASARLRPVTAGPTNSPSDDAFYTEAGVFTSDSLLYQLASQPSSTASRKDLEQNLSTRILSESREFEVSYSADSAAVAEKTLRAFVALYKNHERTAMAGNDAKTAPVASIVEIESRTSPVEYLPLWLRLITLAIAGSLTSLFFAWYLEWRNPVVRSATVLNAKFGLEVLAELSE